MFIKPSASIRQNYNEIANICKTTGQPVFLTKNGEGDLVVMDIATYQRKEQMQRISSDLLRIKEQELAGAKYLTVDELDKNLEKVLSDVANAKNKAI